MARVDVTTEEITRAGLVPTLTAPTVDGDVVDAGRVALMVTNNGAAAHTVTVQSPVTVDGLDVEELTVSVAVGDTVLIGPWPRRTFGRPAGTADEGRVYVDYDTGSDADLVRTAVTI